jgi:hypothetical protein
LREDVNDSDDLEVFSQGRKIREVGRVFAAARREVTGAMAAAHYPIALNHHVHAVFQRVVGREGLASLIETPKDYLLILAASSHYLNL